MGEKTPATTTQNQTGTSVSNPYAPATGLISDVINQYAATPSTPSTAQTNAGNALVSAAGSVPSFGGQGADAVRNIFQNAGILNSAYGNLQSNLGATASGANLDPSKTPGFSTAMDTLGQDITNRVKGVYAGSGRDPSGAGDFAGTLSRGLMQGQAPILQAQANQNQANMMQANQILQNAGISTTGALSGNTMQALQAAGILPQVAMAPATAQMQAANTQQQIPYLDLQQKLQAAGLLGGMGGTTNTTGNAQGTQTPANDPLSNIIGGVSAGAGLIGAFSDRDLKTDVKDIGRTHDNQKIYSYRFKGQNVPQVGMMADEVEKTSPEAVSRDPASGFKKVRYDLATRKAARMGMMEAA